MRSLVSTLALGFAVLICQILPGISKDSTSALGDTYIFDGFDISDARTKAGRDWLRLFRHRFAVLRLQFDRTESLTEHRGKGDLRPLSGYSGGGVEVSAVRSGTDEMLLSLGAPLFVTAKFQRSVYAEVERWQRINDDSKPIELSQTDSFYRNMYEAFSSSALTLQQDSCGATSQVLELRPKDGFNLYTLNSAVGRTKSDLWDSKVGLFACPNFSTADLPQLDMCNISDEAVKLTTALLTIPMTQHLVVNLQDDLQELGILIAVPLGSEAFYARLLRSTELFDYVGLENGPCGGLESTEIIVKKKIPGLYDDFESKFAETLRTAVDWLIRERVGSLNARLGSSFSALINEMYVSPSRSRAFSKEFRIHIIGPSEIFDGAPKEWTSLYLVVRAFEGIGNTDNEITLEVFTERMRNSKRSSGSDSPPGSEYFDRGELTPEHEMRSALSIASGLAEHLSGLCSFDSGESEGDFDQKKCVGYGPFVGSLSDYW